MKRSSKYKNSQVGSEIVVIPFVEQTWSTCDYNKGRKCETSVGQLNCVCGLVEIELIFKTL